jgi:hypothetical protein
MARHACTPYAAFGSGAFQPFKGARGRQPRENATEKNGPVLRNGLHNAKKNGDDKQFVCQKYN